MLFFKWVGDFMRRIAGRSENICDRRNAEKGSVLLLVMGTLAIVSLTAILALNSYRQNAIISRTSNAKVESNALVNTIQQTLSNQSICTNALIGSGVKFDQPGFGSNEPSVSVSVPIASLSTNIGGGPARVIASPGMVSNGVSLSSTQESMYLNPTNAYSPLGLQPSSAPAGIANNYCGQTTMSVTAQKGISISRLPASQLQAQSPTPASSYNVMGSSSITQEFPFTIISDKNGNIQSCFAGEALGVCQPPINYSVGPLQITGPCVDGGFSATTVGQSTMNWTINPPIPPESESLTCSTGGTNSTTFANIPVGDYLSGGMVLGGGSGRPYPLPYASPYTCVLTVTNSANQPFTSPPMTTSFRSDLSCNPLVTLTINGSTNPSCIYSGNSHKLAWTDTDTASDDNATVTVTGTGTGAVTLNNQNPNDTATETAPVVTTGSQLSYIAKDDQSGDSSTKVSIMVSPSPIAGTLTVNSATSIQVGAGAELTFAWTSQNQQSVALQETSPTVAPMGSYNAPQSSVVIAAPNAVGAYDYQLSATGYCGGIPPTSNQVTVMVTPSPSPSSAPSPSGCGSASGQTFYAPPVAPNLCTTGTASAVTDNAGKTWNWTCSVGSGAPKACSATNSFSNCQSFSVGALTSGNVSVSCGGGYPTAINGGCSSQGRMDLDYLSPTGQTCHQNGGTVQVDAYITCCADPNLSITPNAVSVVTGNIVSVGCPADAPYAVNGSCNGGTGRITLDFMQGGTENCQQNGGSGNTTTAYIDCTSTPISCQTFSNTLYTSGLVTMSCPASYPNAVSGGCNGGTARIGTNYLSNGIQNCAENVGTEYVTAYILCCQ
jgi:hypothetical protein